MKISNLLIALCLMWLVISLSACGSSDIERALVGSWKSKTSTATFVFSKDRSYIFEQPGRAPIAGRYHVLGNPNTLSDAQFDLGTIGIRFTAQGDAFYIYVDGAGGSELFYPANK